MWPVLAPMSEGRTTQSLRVGSPIPLAEKHEGDDAVGLMVTVERLVDEDDTVDRWVTVAGVDRNWRVQGWDYLMSPDEALRLAAELSTAAMTLLGDLRSGDGQ
ncbi:hypothetical protein RU01_15390 [Rhodococcus sp. MEB064]|nr:hypothetical protein RU01_15390 [Rhodococcus sp. MEB064]